MPCARGCCESQIEHYRSLSISPAATPSRSPDAARINATEKRWEKDMKSYKALRADGLQPKQIDGCSVVEANATHPKEVELMRPLPKAVKDAS